VPVRIEQLDPGSARDLSDAAALMTLAWRIALLDDTEPAFPPESIPRELLRHGVAGRTSAGWLARDGERAVALCTVVTHSTDPTRVWMPELWVAPSDRRRRIATLLLERAVAFTRAHGRTVLNASHYEAAPASIALCVRHGARPTALTIQSRVRTANLDRGLIERWRTPPAGYELVREDVGSQWFVRARHDGRDVGMTELLIEPHRAWLVHQGDTEVDPAHRRRGVARALKAESAHRLLAERPDARVIETFNDASNEAVLSLNRTFGFRAVALWRDVDLVVA
jgi:GNAT superfamily N-acetyltransferase